MREHKFRGVANLPVTVNGQDERLSPPLTVPVSFAIWQTRRARHRRACPPLSILGEKRSLPKYENIDFILGKLGIKVPSSHFCRLCQDILGKQCIGAPRCACGHFTIPASNACVYTHRRKLRFPCWATSQTL